MADGTRPSTESIEAAIRELSGGPPEQAIVALTAVTNRAIIELNRVAREQAKQQRGQAEWGRWARLANAVRSGVLQIAAIRDSVKALGLHTTAGAPSPMEGDPANDGSDDGPSSGSVVSA